MDGVSPTIKSSRGLCCVLFPQPLTTRTSGVFGLGMGELGRGGVGVVGGVHRGVEGVWGGRVRELGGVKWGVG